MENLIGSTHKDAYWLELVDTEALLQAEQAVDPDRERHESAMSGENDPQWSTREPRNVGVWNVSSSGRV